MRSPLFIYTPFIGTRLAMQAPSFYPLGLYGRLKSKRFDLIPVLARRDAVPTSELLREVQRIVESDG